MAVGLNSCAHHPVCPIGTPRWHCHKRTEIETAVKLGRITRTAGTQLLVKYGVPCSRLDLVYDGLKPETERFW